ncbi:MAG: FIST C-terminal domain-containing protein [Polyangiaceae bacterium]|nr:FIST C-terminal domain-containing protein [Polyangiaceae bacterium]
MADLLEQLRPTRSSATFVFASAHYDLELLGRALGSLPGRVYGCTTAGLIGCRGLQQSGMTAVTLSGPRVKIEPFVISPLLAYRTRALEVGHSVRARIADCPVDWTAAGLLLIDGLSGMEERVVSALYHALPHLPLVGGSAGDDLAFQTTRVYVDGQFLSDAAVFLLLSTSLPLRSIRCQHYEPTAEKLVVTEADARRRILYELDGVPAALTYAERVGVPADRLSANDFSRAPLMVRVGSEYYIRSVRQVNADHSLTLYCAVDRGHILTLGRPGDPLAALDLAFRQAREAAGEPELVLGFDCVLRRLEFQQQRIDATVARLMQENRVVGFNSYGEQYNSLHVNQTFTGLVMGARDARRG